MVRSGTVAIFAFVLGRARFRDNKGTAIYDKRWNAIVISHAFLAGCKRAALITTSVWKK